MKAERILIAAIAVSVILAAGCDNHIQRKRLEARARWGESRAEMLTKLAEGSFKRGEMGRSRDCVEEALTGAPKYAPLYVMAARLAVERGELDTAAAYAENARIIDPQSARAHYVLGTVEQALGRFDKACVAFAEAARLDPANEACVLAEAEMRVACNEALLAAEGLQEAVSRMPGRAAIHMAYGDVLCLLGRYDEAVGAYRIASRLDPRRDDLAERIAVALYYAGAYDEAEPLLAELVASRTDTGAPWLASMRAECLIALGRVPQAREIYVAQMKDAPGSIELLLAMAKCDILENRLGDARARIEVTLARQPAHAEANALMGYLLVEGDRPGQAVSHLRLALKDQQAPYRKTVELLLNRASAPEDPR